MSDSAHQSAEGVLAAFFSLGSPGSGASLPLPYAILDASETAVGSSTNSIYIGIYTA